MRKLTLFLVFIVCTFAAKAQTPTYVQTPLITNLAYPVAFTFTPDGRILVTHKGGTISIYSSTGTSLGTFYNMSDSTYNLGERGLLGIEVDPDFASNNYVYVYYNHRCCVSTTQTGPQFIRIVRFTESGNVGTNPTIIMEEAVGNIPGFHVGGNLRFRSSDPNHIYVTIGDIGTQNNAQQLTNPYGKVLRIHKNGSIPASNPFYDDGDPATGNDDRIWDYGHRNHFDLCASPVNDSLYYSENGTSPNNNGADEVGMVTRGANHGWPSCEAFDNYNSSTPCSNAAFQLPLDDLPPFNNTMPAVTGVLFYSGSGFTALTNHLLVADANFGRISDLTLGNPPYYDTVLSNVVWDDFTNSGLTTLKEGTDGCIYALEAPWTTNMDLHRICPTPQAIIETEQGFSLHNPAPNPANENFSLRWSMKKEARVSAEIFDLAGKKIASVLNETRAKGEHVLELSRSALGLSEGAYFIRLTFSDGAQQYVRTKKIVLLR